MYGRTISHSCSAGCSVYRQYVLEYESVKSNSTPNHNTACRISVGDAYRNSSAASHHGVSKLESEHRAIEDGSGIRQ
ncbi:hypothetical protein TNCV_416701 [Trichonephila clavipes]|nr:hypothetical protein TNCV_416701 [Trichonephila clavipes]